MAKTVYFVLDTVCRENGLHYPVICKTENNLDRAMIKVKTWIGPRHYLDNFSLCYTKKNAVELCENMRREYRTAGRLEFEGTLSFETV